MPGQIGKTLTMLVSSQWTSVILCSLHHLLGFYKILNSFCLILYCNLDCCIVSYAMVLFFDDLHPYSFRWEMSWSICLTTIMTWLKCIWLKSFWLAHLTARRPERKLAILKLKWMIKGILTSEKMVICSPAPEDLIWSVTYRCLHSWFI